MTLILSCFTPNYIVQLADRRLTCEQNGVATIYDENANKVVFYQNAVVFAFTGIYRVDDIPTDLWISKTIRKCSSVDNALQTLYEALNESNERQRKKYRNGAMLTVGAVMWARRDDDPILRPWSIEMSNQFDPVAGTGTGVAGDRFYSRAVTSPPNLKFYTAPALGIPIDSDILAYENRLGRAVKKLERLEQSISAPMLGRFIQSGILRGADRNNRVGRSLTMTILHSPESSQPLEQRAQFGYLPANSKEVIAYAPNIVLGPLAMHGIGLVAASPSASPIMATVSYSRTPKK